MSLRQKTVLALLLALLLLVLGADILLQGRAACCLPVLMYHHFDETSTADTVVTAQRFREQMTALKARGYTAVTLQQVLDYVEQGVPLPDKPVLITMDDGYTSNLTVAAPVLEEVGFCATVFVIGINEGEEIYAHSGNPLYPARFSYEEAAVWVEKGVLDLQSHTFDMHQQASYGFSGRDGLLPLPGESDEAYQAALRADTQAFRQRRQASTELLALAYPFGFFDARADGALREAGIRCTFTVLERKNLLRVGDPACLWNMGRYNVTDGWSGEELADRLDAELAFPLTR